MIVNNLLKFNICDYRNTENSNNTHFTASFPGKPKVNRYQKGRTILDFNEARDDGKAVASAEPYANYLHLASDR